MAKKNKEENKAVEVAKEIIDNRVTNTEGESESLIVDTDEFKHEEKIITKSTEGAGIYSPEANLVGVPVDNEEIFQTIDVVKNDEEIIDLGKIPNYADESTSDGFDSCTNDCESCSCGKNNEVLIETNKYLIDVKTIMNTFNQKVRGGSKGHSVITLKEIKLRRDLAIEELRETGKAINGLHSKVTQKERLDLMTEIVDGLVDQMVVTTGSFLAYGVQDNKAHRDFNDIIETFILKDTNFTVDYMNKTNKQWTDITASLGKIESAINELYGQSINDFLYHDAVSSKDWRYRPYLYNILIELSTLINVLGVNEELFNLSWKEVQRANLSKLDINGNVVYNSSGKFIKSDQYIAPNLRDIVESYI